MDMSFANQFMSQLRLAKYDKQGILLEPEVIDIPEEQDREIAGIKLRAMKYKIDRLTEEQRHYMDDYSAGT